MSTYVVNVHLRGIAPMARNRPLDHLMDDLGFFPWKPSVPPDEHDEDKSFSRWEYAANSVLDRERLTAILEGRIRSVIHGDVDLTVSQVIVQHYL